MGLKLYRGYLIGLAIGYGLTIGLFLLIFFLHI